MFRTRFLLLFVVGAFSTGTPPAAFAQITAGTTAAYVGDGLIAQNALSLDMAEAIARGVIEQCRADGFRVSVSVIDAAGLLKAFLRDEGTGPHTIELGRQKAYAALTFHTRWTTTWDAAQELGYVLGSPMANVEGASLLGGGVPIRVEGVAIGAVGVSGARGGDRDEICANAGIAKIAHLLE
jgi:uncharacterized protein GlcG (DUF336 family)